MTPSSSTGRTVRSECRDHDRKVATMGDRHVDLQGFRLACADLRDRLEEMGPSDDEEAEGRRQSLMRSLDGILEESACNQSMIMLF